MFTSNEIRNIEFEEEKRGYNQTDVKAFLRKISEQIETMEKERAGVEAEKTAIVNDKAALEQKMIILADKVEDYRKDEDNLRTALLSAQRLSDTIVKEANANAEVILNDAKLKAEGLLDETARKIEAEKESFAKIRKEVSKFKNEVLSIYKSHLEILSMIPESEYKTETAEPITEPYASAKDSSDLPEPSNNENIADGSAEGESDVTINSADNLVIDPVSVQSAELPAEPIAETTTSVIPEYIQDDTSGFIFTEPVSEQEQLSQPDLSDSFYIPQTTEVPASPFASFEQGQQDQGENDIQEAAATQEIVIPEEAEQTEEEKNEPSRFGQLDFGEGFSFTSK